MNVWMDQQPVNMSMTGKQANLLVAVFLVVQRSVHVEKRLERIKLRSQRI